MDWAYVSKLLAIGFRRKQVEEIAKGREVDGLTEAELLQFCHAWENDKVEPMKPLVEKYGWEELVERLEKSTP